MHHPLTYTPTYEVPTSSRAEPPNDAYDIGYDESYNQGLEDGKNGHSHGYGYNDSSDYYNYYETRYQEGYEEGYDEGYSSGKSQYEEEQEESEEEQPIILNDMKHITLFILATLLVACENKPKNNDSPSTEATDYPSNNGY